MVVWQHLGVDTKHPFYANRIPEFISIRTNRSVISKIPLNRVQHEIPGNFKGKKLTIDFEEILYHFFWVLMKTLRLWI